MTASIVVSNSVSTQRLSAGFLSLLQYSGDQKKKKKKGSIFDKYLTYLTKTFSLPVLPEQTVWYEYVSNVSYYRKSLFMPVKSLFWFT